ncbi:MAG TPA: LysM domain-containing protein, partial [Acidimicrobiales bacterium]|nr:LysM domain-containing protein [Acidimicrobiales bacterium]
MRHATVPCHRGAVVPGPRPALRLLEGGAGRRRAQRARYRRRRLAVAVLGALVLLGARAALGLPEGGSPATPGPAPATTPAGAGPPTHVVQPGDTLWTIARTLQPEADVRPLVDRLAAARNGAPLRPGE